MVWCKASREPAQVFHMFCVAKCHMSCLLVVTAGCPRGVQKTSPFVLSHLITMHFLLFYVEMYPPVVES